MAVLMFIDGVLRNPKKAPIKEGMLLYHSLKEKNRVLLLCSDKDKDDNWLRQQKLNRYDDLVGMEKVPPGEDLPELRQVEWVRSQGHVDFVITYDPTLSTKLIDKGVTTLLFVSPLYADETHRPDTTKGTRAWADIVEAIVKQQDMFKEDPRVS